MTLILFLTLKPSYALSPKAITTEYPAIQNNSLIAVSVPYTIKFQVLADLTDYDSVKEKYPVVDCIIQNESGWNPKAVGDNGKAYSILQFHRATFDFFSAKYGLKLDYENPNDQLILFEKMLDSDFNLIKHWTTSKKCL